MSEAAADETLQAAIDAALDEARLREKALNMACAQFKKINWTGDAKRIVAMADTLVRWARAAFGAAVLLDTLLTPQTPLVAFVACVEMSLCAAALYLDSCLPRPPAQQHRREAWAAGVA